MVDYSQFKDKRDEEAKNGNLYDSDGGDEARFVNHGLDAIFEIRRIYSGICEKPKSYYENHPYHSYVMEVVQINSQDEYKPYHENDAKKEDFTPTPADQVEVGDTVKRWLALPRVPDNMTDEEWDLLQADLQTWAAIFQVQTALVDMDQITGITEEDGKELEGRLIGVNFKPREYEYEDDQTGEEGYGVTIDEHPYAVDQDTLEKVDLRGAYDVAEGLVDQCKAGEIGPETVAENLDYFIEINEMAEEDAKGYMEEVA